MPTGTVDLGLLDTPFGIMGRAGRTSHEWDRPVRWELLWPELWRVLKSNGTLVIFAGEPLASVLSASHLDTYKYHVYWLRKASNIFQSRWRPLSVVESILVFSAAAQTARTYNAQKQKLKQIYDRLARRRLPFLGAIRDYSEFPSRMFVRDQHPIDLIVPQRHPLDRPVLQHCQKPVELLRYLIRTYSQPGEVVLDITLGAFSTAIACQLEGRKFIGFEQHEKHFNQGVQRLRNLIAAAAKDC